ncbi:MAG TPA: PaaI family thioesterase [Candidatus Dormibacteraeota bacterium]|nr:PaaI family thioesterase [Candidatus Dormibacteraeota bacterium]
MATWLELFKRGEGHPARGGWAEPYGIRVTTVEAGHVVLEFDASEKHHQPNGVVQGGVLTAIADAAMGMAGMTVQEIGWANTTIELKINFIRPVIRGLVKAEGRVVQAGKTVLFLEASVTNEDGKLAALATSSVLAFRQPAREHTRAE